MPAVATQNPAIRSESKSAKKKKVKSDETTASGTTATSGTTLVETTASNGISETASGDGSYESPYIKELYK